MGRVDRRLRRLGGDARGELRRLLRTARFELLPLPGAGVAARRLPAGAEVAVTADPDQGMDPTVELSVDLAAAGFVVIPHLAAQMVPDRAALEAHLSRMAGAGIERALVVGGVSDAPGEFSDALDLIRAMDGSGIEIGVAGYPEGHHEIPVEVVDRALIDKAPHAAWVTSQICFDPARIGEWADGVRADGVEAPLWVGVPGVADMTGLMSLGLRLGAGRSLQFMFEHPRLVSRLLRPGGRGATELVIGLAEVAAIRSDVAGIHVFTYNQTRAAERWRRRLLERVTAV